MHTPSQPQLQPRLAAVNKLLHPPSEQVAGQENRPSSFTLRPECIRQTRWRVKASSAPGVSSSDPKAAPVYCRLTLEFLEAVHGAQKTVHAQVLRICPDCKGRRVRPGVAASTCGFCRGTGKVLRFRQGMQEARRACPGCGGHGLQAQQWCRRCGGIGLARVPLSLKIRVPAGVQADSVLRIRTQGDLSRDGHQQGDVHVVIAVEALEGMSRQGSDVYSALSLPYPEAILGCSTEIGTVRGMRPLVIPAGTQHATQLTLLGEGVDYKATNGSSRRGAHHVTVYLQLPHLPSPVERAILMELSGLQPKL